MSHWSELTVAAMLLALLGGTVGASASGPGSRGPVEARLSEPDLDPVLRERALRVLAELGPLVTRLPVEDLRELRVDEGGLEFRFQVRRHARIVLPGVERLVLDERTGGPLGITVEGATLRVGERLRLVWSGEEVRGDLEVKHGWLWLDLAARTETRAPEVVRDGEGRPFLRTDALGRPVRNVDGSYEFERAEHWLCLEAGGRRMELALPLVP